MKWALRPAHLVFGLPSYSQQTVKPWTYWTSAFSVYATHGLDSGTGQALVHPIFYWEEGKEE